MQQVPMHQTELPQLVLVPPIPLKVLLLTPEPAALVVAAAGVAAVVTEDDVVFR